MPVDHGNPIRGYLRLAFVEWRLLVVGWGSVDDMMCAADVIEVLTLLTDARVTAWVDGGWGVDALIGETSRDHTDLDLVVDAEHLDRVRETLRRAGFLRVVRDWLPTALAVADTAGRQIDLHPVTRTPDGGGDQLLANAGRFHYPPPATGWIGGHEVRCVDATTQALCHLGYPPRDKDRHDMALLHQHAGVALPRQYEDTRQRPDSQHHPKQTTSKGRPGGGRRTSAVFDDDGSDVQEAGYGW